MRLVMKMMRWNITKDARVKRSCEEERRRAVSECPHETGKANTPAAAPAAREKRERCD